MMKIIVEHYKSDEEEHTGGENVEVTTVDSDPEETTVSVAVAPVAYTPGENTVSVAMGTSAYDERENTVSEAVAPVACEPPISFIACANKPIVSALPVKKQVRRARLAKISENPPVVSQKTVNYVYDYFHREHYVNGDFDCIYKDLFPPASLHYEMTIAVVCAFMRRFHDMNPCRKFNSGRECRFAGREGRWEAPSNMRSLRHSSYTCISEWSLEFLKQLAKTSGLYLFNIQSGDMEVNFLQLLFEGNLPELKNRICDGRMFYKFQGAYCKPEHLVDLYMECLDKVTSRCDMKVVRGSYQQMHKEMTDLLSDIRQHYESAGFSFDGYYRYVNKKHPIYLQSIGAIPITIPTFEASILPNSVEKGEVITKNIIVSLEQSPNNISRAAYAAGSTSTTYGDFYQRKHLKEAILNLVARRKDREKLSEDELRETLRARLNYSLITGNSKHSHIVLPGFGVTQVSRKQYRKLSMEEKDRLRHGRKDMMSNQFYALVLRRMYTHKNVTRASLECMSNENLVQFARISFNLDLERDDENKLELIDSIMYRLNERCNSQLLSKRSRISSVLFSDKYILHWFLNVNNNLEFYFELQDGKVVVPPEDFILAAKKRDKPQELLTKALQCFSKCSQEHLVYICQILDYELGRQMREKEIPEIVEVLSSRCLEPVPLF